MARLRGDTAVDTPRYESDNHHQFVGAPANPLSPTQYIPSKWNRLAPAPVPPKVVTSTRTLITSPLGFSITPRCPLGELQREQVLRAVRLEAGRGAAGVSGASVARMPLGICSGLGFGNFYWCAQTWFMEKLPNSAPGSALSSQFYLSRVRPTPGPGPTCRNRLRQWRHALVVRCDGPNGSSSACRLRKPWVRPRSEKSEGSLICDPVFEE